jgi:hypothetical protein
VENAAENAAEEWLRRPQVRAVRLDSAAQGDVGAIERGEEKRQLVRRRRHVGVGEDHAVAGRRKHPGTDRGPLARVRDAHRGQPRRDCAGCLGLRPSGGNVERSVRAPVVDEKDVEPLAELWVASEVSEQLVKRALEPGGLVVGGQDERHPGGGHRRQSSRG